MKVVKSKLGNSRYFLFRSAFVCRKPFQLKAFETWPCSKIMINAKMSLSLGDFSVMGNTLTALEELEQVARGSISRALRD